MVEPGFFRTELLVEGASTHWPELSIKDYDQRTLGKASAGGRSIQQSRVTRSRGRTPSPPRS
jgi:hypothetical protein